MIKINLLAVDRDRVKRKAKFQIGQKITAACSLVLVVAALGVGWWFWYLQRTSTELDQQIAAAQRETQRLEQEAIAARSASDQPGQRVVGGTAEGGVVGEAVEAERGVVRQRAVGQIETAPAEQIDERRQAIEEDGGGDAHACPPTAATPTGHDTPVPPIPQ